MVAKRGAASGNARTARSKKVATSAAAVAAEEAAPAQKGGWGLKGAATQPDPESEPELPGVGLNGQQEPVTEPVDEVVAPKAKRGGRKANVGHTPAQDASDDGALNLSNMTSDLVKGVEQLERIAEEIGALRDDAKEFMSELKSKGYSTKIIRKAISRRAMDPDKRAEEDSLLDLYEEALRGSGQDD